jgi:hypothetical protein
VKPTLKQPYAAALDEVVDWLRAEYAPIGIVVSGKIVRGTGQASSDLDIVAIHEEPWRQRVQRFFNGVPCEMFVNPHFHIPRQMAKDAAEGRPVMAHMLATGVIVEDPTGIVATLVDAARANLAAGPQVPAEALQFRQYGIATQFEDAVDLREIDQARSRSLVIDALVEAVKWHFLNLGKWLPRSKALLNDFDARDPDLGADVRAALREPDLDRQIELAEPIVRRIIGHSGFYEWDGDREALDPD